MEAAADYVAAATGQTVEWQPRHWQDPESRYVPALASPAPVVVSQGKEDSTERLNDQATGPNPSVPPAASVSSNGQAGDDTASDESGTQGE